MALTSDAPPASDEASIERLRALIDFVARSLVDSPDAVRIDIADGDRDSLVLELTVAEGDLGKVIGREGRTARAMRTLLSATSAKLRRRVILDILE